jgi:phosphoglycerol transferase MdoB-like AlkP superfamily enzyme
MSDKAKAYTYAAGYFGLLLLLMNTGIGDSISEWLDSQDTFVWLLFISGPLLPIFYWLRNEESSGKNLGVLAVIGFIAGVLLGKKID